MINSPIPRIGGKRLLRTKICDSFPSGERFNRYIEFTEDDHKRLASQLSQIQGKFLLSYNDDTFIRELYKDYTIVSLSRNNNISSGSFKELLIRNY